MKKLLLFTILMLISLAMFAQKGTDLIISEYVEGWSTNKAIELYNPTDSAIDLSQYRLTRYSNGSTPPIASAQWYVILSGTIMPYQARVFVLDKRDPNATGQDAPIWDALRARADTFVCPVYNDSYALYFNGNDAVSLEKLDDTFIDIFGKIGEDPGTAWTDTDPFNTGAGIPLSSDHTLVRKASINAGVIAPIDKFNILAEWDSLPANTFTSLGWHEFSASPDSNAKPAFSETSYSFTINIDDPSGTSVGTVSATDPNGDVISFFISKGNSYDPFTINKATGEITIAKTEELYWRDYTLGIDISDGTSPVSMMVDVTVEGGYTGIQSISHNIEIFPNPVENGFFRINSSQEISNLEVYSLTGKMVMSQVSKNEGSVMDVQLSDVHPGMYMLKVRFSDDTGTARKILIK